MKMKTIRARVGKRFRIFPRVRLLLVGDVSEMDPAPA